MNDAISRSAVLDIINKEICFAKSLRETIENNEDRAHNAGELSCACMLARNVKELPTLDVALVVHARYNADGICTHCGYPMPTRTRFESIWDDEIDFCFKCGARTDGESEEKE